MITSKPTRITYPHFIKFFADKNNLSEEDFIAGVHMVYGWMPTIPTIHRDELSIEQILEYLHRVKNNRTLNEVELLALAKVINESIVGTSKLLHFIAPQTYPIWDSKVYCFVVNESKAPQNKVNNFENYCQYMDVMRDIAKSGRVHIDDDLRGLIGNPSEIRMIELIMFQNSPLRKKDKAI